MNKTAISTNLAAALSIDADKAGTLADTLVEIVKEQLAAGNNVAVPGFGQFATVNEPEQIITDLSTGKRLMLPPVIEIVFTPATAISKDLKK
ncbi:MAG: HU family DNA-binding protein [Muribaculaceae bacterium]|nr:HU family DNA-binding protein [Muribaculaceae bacterium]